MNYLFFDIETTGLARSSAILQFSGILCDENLDIIKVINTYYYAPFPVPSSAAAIHGLTMQKLEFLAECDFEEGADEIYDLLTQPNLTLVGHNIKSYDLQVLKYNLEAVGYDINPDDLIVYDTLIEARQRYSGKHNLESALNKFLAENGNTLEDIKALFLNVPELIEKCPQTETKLHSALFDSFCVYCLYTFLTNGNS